MDGQGRAWVYISGSRSSMVGESGLRGRWNMVCWFVTDLLCWPRYSSRSSANGWKNYYWKRPPLVLLQTFVLV